MMSNKVLRGTVHGNVIELEDNAGISDGDRVEIIVRRVTPQSSQLGEGLSADFQNIPGLRLENWLAP